MDRNYSAALPFAYLGLRILIVLNGLMGVAILGLLAATIVAPGWTMTALGIAGDSYIRPILPGLQGVAVLGLVTIPLNHLILKRLIAIVVTVRIGDPFIAPNARRLEAIGWALLALQIIAIVIGAIGEAISTRAHPIDLDAGFSATGWLGVLLTFVLARIFSEGARMRDDLVGTV